jgi:hypothetical protein
VRQRSPVLIVLLILAACSPSAGPSAGPTPSSPAGSSSSVGASPASQPQEPPRPTVSGPSPSSRAADPSPCPPVTGTENFGQLTDIRVGKYDTYDRVTFEFMPGNTSGSAPNYDLRNVTSFTKDPSDKPMQVAGVSFLQLVFQGASGVDPNGVVTYHGPSELKPGYPVLAEIELRGDFERVLSFIIGLTQHRCPVVRTMSGPLRLVIDLPH